LRANVDLDAYVPGFADLHLPDIGVGTGPSVSQDDADVNVVDIDSLPDQLGVDPSMALDLGDEREPDGGPAGPPIIGVGAGGRCQVVDDDPPFFTDVIPIPGIMHVLHNAVKDITACMEVVGMSNLILSSYTCRRFFQIFRGGSLVIIVHKHHTP
jgi:hypothetical protein